jgi:carboxyl-terminal processing protease
VTMMRARVVLLGVSLIVVLAFSGLLLAGHGSEDELFKTLGTLSEVVHLVLSEYVDELNQDALAVALDSGFVESLDPSAAVVPADSVDAFKRQVGNPPAYGLVFGLRLGSAAVRHTVPGSPAAAAGLETWEVIERVEGVNTRARPLWQIRVELADRFGRAEPVHLTVVDRLVDARREVVLEATPWQPESATSEERQGVAVIRVESLPVGAAATVGRLVVADRALVLDLRELVWGDEEEAVRTADLFVASGVLGTWRGRKAGEKTFPADPATLTARPPVVLVGADTEGVGEILAGALQRAGAAVVGQPTSGRASHMLLVQDGDLSLWLPVAYWLRPDGTPIHDQGVAPDEKVELPEEPAGDADPVLDRGVELARDQLPKAA